MLSSSWIETDIPPQGMAQSPWMRNDLQDSEAGDDRQRGVMLKELQQRVPRQTGRDGGGWWWE